jgi:uncharacterized membrane protein
VEIVVYLFLLVLVLALLVGPLVLSLVAYFRSRHVTELTRRMERLEAMVRALQPEGTERAVASVLPAGRPAPSEPVEPLVALTPVEAPPAVASPGPGPIAQQWPPVVVFDWEWFIGRRALGWVAVILIVFATGFFLRYAFENNWIGPIGRVSLAALGGLGLVIAGWHYATHRGWRLFAQMLSGAGVVLIYLATYSAFGFYHLLPQRYGALYLLIVVVETMALAALYDAPALALVAVLGGLLTPVLMRSESDQYTALFLYLGLFNAGVLLLALWRPWPAVSTLAFVGTQLLFWSWYNAHYHPEKLLAALGFLTGVFLLFLGQIRMAHAARGGAPRTRGERVRRWEDLALWLLNGFFGFLGFYVLLDPDYGAWMGTLSVAMAVLYAALALGLLTGRREDEGLFLTTLAIAVGFIATALALQAKAPWIALGWAAEGAVLWWFGLRVRSLPLRGLAAVLALAASIRVIFIDTLDHASGPAPGWPFVNEQVLPAIGASACLMAALATTRRLQRGLAPLESGLILAAEVVGTLQLWLVLSVDLYRYCQGLSGPATRGDDRLAQMALSILWALYATVLLVAGFRFRLARLRWTALGLYGVTIAKVFLLDMAGLDEIYRILAFLVLAVVLGAAARVYQRIAPELEKPVTREV